jgi:hypothetical protein
MRAKMKYICKKFINYQIKKCLLFRCRHPVVIMQTLNWTNQCPLFMTVRHIFEISEDAHPPNTPTSLVTHARDDWWTLDFANAFVSPGINNRGELVPSHGASRRRLADYRYKQQMYNIANFNNITVVLTSFVSSFLFFFIFKLNSHIVILSVVQNPFPDLFCFILLWNNEIRDWF